MALRVFVDYNTATDDLSSRISINTQLFKHLLDILSPGLPLVLYDEDSLEVDAVAEFNHEYQCWYGLPDWSTRRDLPPLTEEELKRIRDSWSI